MSASAGPSSAVDEDLVDDSLVSHDIVSDSRLTAAPARKALSKDKEKALAEEAVDKVKAGAEERDEDNTEDSQVSLAHSARGRRAAALQPSAAAAASSGAVDGDAASLSAYLSSASDATVYADLSVRFEDTRAEADQTFIVLGDALLLQLLNDRLLSWSPSWTAEGGALLGCGGQFLHAAFAFERELSALCEGGRQCRVLWIDALGAAVTAQRSDYSALRRILQRHVRGHCALLQDEFAQWWDEEFAAFLERIDPAFLIVGDGHDAAYATHAHLTDSDAGVSEGSSSASSGPPSPSSLLRSLTLFLLSRNFRCIRLSELQSTANGIFAFQYQMPIEYQHQLRMQPRNPQHAAAKKRPRDEEKAGDATPAAERWRRVSSAVSALPSIAPSPAPSRLTLTCYALAESLAQQGGESLSTSVEVAKSVLLQCVLLSSLPLPARRFEDVALARQLDPSAGPPPCAAVLDRFFAHLDAALSVDTAAPCDASLVDVFDLRLLLTITALLQEDNVRSLGLSRAQAALLEDSWALLCSTVRSSSPDIAASGALSESFLPFFSVERLAPASDVESAEEEQRRTSEEALRHAAQRSAEATPKPSAPVSSAAVGSATKGPATEMVRESWDDEDEEEEAAPAPRKAAATPAAATTSRGQWEDEDVEEAAGEELDDWEAMAEESEAAHSAAQKKKAAAAPATGAASLSPSPPSSSLLPPVAVVRQPLLDSLCGSVNAALVRVHSLHEAAPPPLPTPSVPVPSELDVRFLGEEILPEGDILKDRKAMRQHQRQINFMTKYSKSLGGGKIVQREVIVKERPKKDGDGQPGDAGARDKGVGGGGGGSGKAGKPGAGGGKKGGGGGAKVKGASIAEQIKAEGVARARAKEVDRVTRSIAFASALRDLPSRIESLDAASEAYSDEVVVPALMQLLEWQMAWWKEQKAEQSPGSLTEAVRAWTTVQDVYRRFKPHLRLAELHALQRALIQLGFDDIASRMARDYVLSMGAAAVAGEKELTVDPRTVKGVREHSVGMSAARFQMEHGGPFMLRNVASAQDDRVDFYPDAWQARLLDVVDARHSALLVAPTSSGKTFISYYAMKQTLKENAAAVRTKDRRQIVYVAPNKALVNQVSGDIYRRFGDVFGVMTSDWQYRVLSCDVLITVPTSLEALLLDPERAEWVSHLTYVIFDEVHLIGSEEGLLWERCIQICQHAPFLALSATVGNAEAFGDWLARCQTYHQRPLHLILHTQRWADLEKHAYVPQPAHPIMRAAAPAPQFVLDDMHGYSVELRNRPQLSSVCTVHPCSAINSTDLEEQQTLPPELAFSPQDSLSLYDAMAAMVRSLSPSSSSLSPALLASLASLEPDQHFGQALTITKTDAMDYERAIKGELSAWLRAGQSALVHRVVASLSSELRERLAALHALFPSPDDAYDVAFQLRHFLPLLTELNAREQLPAIVFCHDQLLCNQLVIRVVDEFERLQDERRREERTEESERARLKEKEKAVKAMRRLRDKQRNRAAEEELQREGTAGTAAVAEEEDDVYDVDVRFSFLRAGESMDPAEMEWWIARMLWKTGWKRSHPLVKALYRGIGVHHGALVKPYRDAVETLFRAKHLKVVVATQTLALGINMPARCVVFCGDSKLLTPLQYRQMAGRAGRRGFDNVGHVVFYAIPPRKMFRLLKSPLLSLRGQYPVQASFTLRALLFAQGVAAFSSALPLALFPSLVQQSFFAHSHPSPQIADQIAFHFRYAVDFLFQRACLTDSGRAYGLAGFIAHLHPTEPANFLLATLLLDGTLTAITQRFGQDKNGVARDVLFLLAHLFMRVPMPRYVQEARREQAVVEAKQSAPANALHDRSLLAATTVVAAPSSALSASASSFFLLDPLPAFVQSKVDAHNAHTMHWATRYLQAFATLALEARTADAAEGDVGAFNAVGPTPVVPAAAVAATAAAGRSPDTAATETAASAAGTALGAPASSTDGRKRDPRAAGGKRAQQKGTTAGASPAEPSAPGGGGFTVPSSASSSSLSSLTVPAFPDLSRAPPADPALPHVHVDRFTLPRSGLRFPRALNAEGESLTHRLLLRTEPSNGAPGGPSAASATPAATSSPCPIRSPFVALSGWSESFASCRELLRSVRAGVYLDPTALPVLEWTDRSDASLPLNSYLLDFYRHGDLDLLITENGIARARVFDLLKRFDLMLQQLMRALTLLQLPSNAPLLRAFQHLQQTYHEVFAKQALQH